MSDGPYYVNRSDDQRIILCKDLKTSVEDIQKMLGDEFIDVRASDLKPGDMVDLGDSPYFRDPDPNAPRLADYEYGVVSEIIQESSDCLVIDFGNIGTAGYDPDHIFKVLMESK